MDSRGNVLLHDHDRDDCGYVAWMVVLLEVIRNTFNMLGPNLVSFMMTLPTVRLR